MQHSALKLSAINAPRVRAAGVSQIANHHFDSARWNAIDFRSDDVVISSWAKSGTSWLQQIVCQLVFEGEPKVDVSSISPWVDFRIVPLEGVQNLLARQSHRRVMKSHLPATAIPIVPSVSYLYIARDPMDVVWSWYRHHNAFNEDAYRALNETPGRIGPPLGPPDPNFRRYFHRWLNEDGFPFHPYWDNVLSWWNIRHHSNIKLVHFSDLHKYFVRELRSIARHLCIDIRVLRLVDIIEHCSLTYMKANAELVAPLGGRIFKGGAPSFFGNGQDAQWATLLTEADRRACLRVAADNLPEDCLQWLFFGSGSR